MIHKRQTVIFAMTLAAIGMMMGGCRHKSQKVDQPVMTPTMEVEPTVTEAPSVAPTNTPTVTPEPEPTPTEAASWLNDQIEKIKKSHSVYENYTVETYPFGDAVAVVLQPPESKKEFCEYYCDIWIVGQNYETQVEDHAYIDYSVFESGEIEGKSYFRYDLSYPSESWTRLVMVDENQEIHEIGLGGGLISIEGKNLNVSHSVYDMCYSKSDGYACGHTWKPYYNYLDGYELNEYGTHEIKEQEFKIYTGSSDIINKVVEQYSEKDARLIIKYLVWDNDMVTVNIGVESLNDITYYYETYQINTDQTLTKVDSGEGTYVGFMLNENPYVKVLKYNKADNTIDVQIVEWLSPWEESDKRRILELIDQGKIEETEDLWTQEYYLYTDENNKATYPLADDLQIAFRDENSVLKKVNKKALQKDLTKRLLQIKIKENMVTEINEPYMP